MILLVPIGEARLEIGPCAQICLVEEATHVCLPGCIGGTLPLRHCYDKVEVDITAEGFKDDVVLVVCCLVYEYVAGEAIVIIELRFGDHVERLDFGWGET
jgi:hypothetical protein